MNQTNTIGASDFFNRILAVVVITVAVALNVSYLRFYPEICCLLTTELGVLAAVYREDHQNNCRPAKSSIISLEQPPIALT
jgi:hypothetical protein